MLKTVPPKHASKCFMMSFFLTIWQTEMSVLFGQMEPPEKQIGKKKVFFFQCWWFCSKHLRGVGPSFPHAITICTSLNLKVGGINKYVILYSESIWPSVFFNTLQTNKNRHYYFLGVFTNQATLHPKKQQGMFKRKNRAKRIFLSDTGLPKDDEL